MKRHMAVTSRSRKALFRGEGEDSSRREPDLPGPVGDAIDTTDEEDVTDGEGASAWNLQARI